MPINVDEMIEREWTQLPHQTADLLRGHFQYYNEEALLAVAHDTYQAAVKLPLPSAVAHRAALSWQTSATLMEVAWRKRQVMKRLLESWAFCKRVGGLAEAIATFLWETQL